MKFRIIKVKKWRSHDKYRAQRKGWFLWHDIECHLLHGSPAEYDSKQTAMMAIEIYKKHHSKKSKQVVWYGVG